MAKVSILCYSDIHHGEYTNGLTEAVVLTLEDEVVEHAERLGVDFIIFDGDRFVSRNPPSHTRAAVDAKMAYLTSRWPVVALVGNHCREVKNAHSGHSMMHLPTLLSGQHQLSIIDEAGVYEPSQTPMVEFHAIPAGQRAAWVNMNKEGRHSTRPFCIMLFHDILRASLMSNGIPAEHGMEPGLLDKSYYDIVLGGDNHVYQKLGLHNTLGWYIGAPCQHNWGDSKQSRGFLHVVLETGQKPVVTHIPSRAPKFLSFDVSLANDDTTASLSKTLHDDSWVGNIVKLRLSGDLKACSKINTSKLEDALTSSSGARRVIVIAEPYVAYKPIIPELARIQPIEDDWKSYIHSGKVDIQGLDPEYIQTIGLDVLREAKENASG